MRVQLDGGTLREVFDDLTGPGVQHWQMVGRGGLEPPTSRLSGVRSNHLSYRPKLVVVQVSSPEPGDARGCMQPLSRTPPICRQIGGA